MEQPNLFQQMSHNLDEVVSRRGTNSYKWDSVNNDVLPMWVADMDFRTAPTIIEALQKRATHGIFGYTKVPETYYNAIIRWFRRRHGWQIEKEWIIYNTGVVPALSAIIRATTEPGDCVLVYLGHVYTPFASLGALIIILLGVMLRRC